MDLGVKGLNKVKEGVKEVSRDHQKEGHDQSPAENITLQEEVPGDHDISEKIEELNSKDEVKGKSSDTTVLTHEVARKSQTSSVARKKKSCAFCDYKTGKSSHMQRHVKAMHKYLESIKRESKTEASDVDETVPQEDPVQKNIILSEEVPAGQTSVVENALQGQMKKERKCSDCDLTFNKQKNLRRHFISFHTDTSFSCKECNFTTKRSDSLKNHQNSIGHKMQVNLKHDDEELLV